MPNRGGPSAHGAVRLRIWTIVAVVLGAGAIYEAGQCFGCWGSRPVFGMFTIHCEWRNRSVHSMSVYDYLTDTRPRFDPITRVLINHMALTVARKELNNRLGPVESRAEIDVQVLGRVLPCGMEVLAIEFTNPSVTSLKPRWPIAPPPCRPGVPAL